MKRLVITWCCFALCLAIVFGAMGYFTAEVRRMQRRAVVEENARLALWRMDAKLAALLARENSLPVTGYMQAPSDGLVTDRYCVMPDSAEVGDARIAQAPLPPPGTGKTQVDYQQRAVQMMSNAAAIEPDPREMQRGPFKAQFENGRLLLTRPAGDMVNVAALDWPALAADLLAEVRDLLPRATLQPGDDATPYRLTVIPASLVPGAPPAGDVPPATPLLVAWCAVLAAAAAAGVLLHLTLRLSQRRAAFVSAVTHEMRTPLTTLRLYTEMLSQNRVRDEAARQQYLQTLSTEADRLSHLVDNVLAHARLERGKPPEALQVVALADLVARCERRLRTRAAQAQNAIAFEGDGSPAVRADPAIVEQILLNLVDNACKYAPGRDIAVTLRANAIAVADAGPGVAADVRKRLFTPFAKSATDAANSAPGVGLGLALSRRLARAMGGDLRYEDAARFVLTLADASARDA